MLSCLLLASCLFVLIVVSHFPDLKTLSTTDVETKMKLFVACAKTILPQNKFSRGTLTVSMKDKNIFVLYVKTSTGTNMVQLCMFKIMQKATPAFVKNMKSIV